ncbi:hypothetical protein DFH08DRAFT_849600 [Mycena albidolilacea]|uniref:Uncharacterized protein n=1 Tax=Mycena albidolilacea TaxID=1033008 RepID=A0AAD7AEE2_9AGAR|nr:hypothetical protein DFH08DRAFT_849600 [Mycena albidolilacea]
MLHFHPAGLLRLRQYSSPAALKERPSVPLHSSSNWVARDPATRPLGIYENTPKRNHAHSEVFKHWYTPPHGLLPPLWRWDWEDWAGTRMWVSEASPNGLPPVWRWDWDIWAASGTRIWLMKGNSIRKVEARFNGPFRLPAPIEPLVYWDEDGCGHFDSFVFHCGERYYFYDDENKELRRYHGTWASPTAFLRARMNSFVEVAPVSERGHLYTELFPEQEEYKIMVVNS